MTPTTTPPQGSRRNRAARIIAIALLAATLGHSSAGATGDGPVGGSPMGEVLFGAGIVIVITELAFPDFRFEYGSDEEDPIGVTMTWPVVLWLGTRNLGKTWLVTLEPFLEGQYRNAGSEQRVLVGARHMFAPRGGKNGIALEYGAVFGTDGKGGMIGVSPVRLFDPRAQMGFIFRGTMTNQGWRVSVGFDVHLAVL